MKIKALIILFLPAFVFAVLFCFARSKAPVGNPIQVDAASRTLKFHATFNPEAFNTATQMAGYHLIVWKRCQASRTALFQAEPSDRAILEALTQLGSKPSNNLKMECWTRRTDTKDPSPDLHAEGPRLQVRIEWPGRGDGQPVPLHQLFEGGRAEDFDFRFAGNEALIDQWKSGCISCLYSCPGGKVVNAAFSVRDYGKEPNRFRTAAQGLPPSGADAVIHLTLVKSVENIR